jgi:hypothetical protein
VLRGEKMTDGVYDIITKKEVEEVDGLQVMLEWASNNNN